MDKQIYLMNKYQKDANTIAYVYSEEIVLIKREYASDGRAELFEIIQTADDEKVISRRKLEADEMKVSDFDFIKEQLTDVTAEENKAEWRITHKNVSLDCSVNEMALFLPSVEDEYISGNFSDEEKITYENALKVLDMCLTETQKRRFIRNKYHGETTRKIAESEGTSQAAVFKSISLSEEKIKKF